MSSRGLHFLLCVPDVKLESAVEKRVEKINRKAENSTKDVSEFSAIHNPVSVPELGDTENGRLWCGFAVGVERGNCSCENDSYGGSTAKTGDFDQSIWFSRLVEAFLLFGRISYQGVGHLKAGKKGHRHCLDVLASKKRDPTSLFALCPPEGRRG